MKLARLIPRHTYSYARARAGYATSAFSVEKKEPFDTGVGTETKPDVIEKKPSFAKRLFVGEFDTDLMTYPEVLDKEQHETLHEMLPAIENFFDNEGLYYHIFKTCSIVKMCSEGECFLICCYS